MCDLGLINVTLITVSLGGKDRFMVSDQSEENAEVIVKKGSK